MRHLETGRLEKAEQSFSRALELDLEYGPAHNNLGLLHFERGELYEAALAFDSARGLMPDRPEPLNNLGQVYERAGRFLDADANYAAAVELDPENHEYLGNMMRARLRAGRNDQETRELMLNLLMHEKRPEWRSWIEWELLQSLPTHDPAQDDSERLTPPPAPGVDSAAGESTLGPVQRQASRRLQSRLGGAEAGEFGRLNRIPSRPDNSIARN